MAIFFLSLSLIYIQIAMVIENDYSKCYYSIIFQLTAALKYLLYI